MTIFCTIFIGVIKIKIGAYILLEFHLSAQEHCQGGNNRSGSVLQRSSARKPPPKQFSGDGRIQKIQLLLRSESHRIRTISV